MKTKPEFRKKILGVRVCETYKCQVAGCGLDCGDSGTLERHINRAHPDLAATVAVQAKGARADGAIRATKGD